LKKKNLKQTTFRLASFIPILILFIVVYVIFIPKFENIIGGIITGITISVYDFIIEYYAYKHGLWYCYGGFQKIGKYDLHVPIDMSILFFIGGFTLALFSTFPNYLRETFFVEILLLLNPYLDILWILISLIIISLIGALVDFSSKKFGVWKNGETWTYWKCAFFAWFPLLTFPVLLNYLILFLI